MEVPYPFKLSELCLFPVKGRLSSAIKLITGMIFCSYNKEYKGGLYL